MKQKRGVLLASGIIFGVIAVMYAIITLAAIPNVDSVIMPLLEAEMEELIMIGEPELAEETFAAMKSALYIFIVAMAVMAIVDMVLGVLLIKHSKASDDVIKNKKGLVKTAAIVAVFTSGIIITILLILSLYYNVEESVQVVKQAEDIDNMDQKQVNDKFESKIRRLQHLRDTGAITKEEYQKLLKQIFEE